MNAFRYRSNENTIAAAAAPNYNPVKSYIRARTHSTLWVIFQVLTVKNHIEHIIVHFYIEMFKPNQWVVLKLSCISTTDILHGKNHRIKAQCVHFVQKENNHKEWVLKKPFNESLWISFESVWNQTETNRCHSKNDVTFSAFVLYFFFFFLINSFYFCIFAKSVETIQRSNNFLFAFQIIYSFGGDLFYILVG